MFNYSITPLDIEHVDEICEDIRQQYEKGVSSCALFCFKLVPEGDPLIDKAEIQCQKYDLFRDKLASMGLECGVLVQCSIGHGYPLDAPSTLNTITNLNDGRKVNVICPTDQRFREYLRHEFSVIAAHKPKHIMLDDDFRLIIRPGKGCACEAHLDAFEKKTGVRKTREEIWAHAVGLSEEDAKYRNAFVETQLESLVECAKYMREGIDAVDPTIPGSFCCVGPCCEAATEIATIIAGKGNPVQVRVNNGRYSPQGPKQFSNTFMRAAVQIAVLKAQGHVDNFLAETDTCPQNRYSTGAMSLHTHFTGTILEGVSGAKHWITRMANFEPVAGRKYREVLGKYEGFYGTLSEIVPTLKWRGSRIPISSVPDYTFNAAGYGARASTSGWGMCVLERLGLPFYFAEKTSDIAFLDGEMDSLFSDEALKEILSKTLVLDGGCAERLCKRGFSEYLGVEVKPWNGKNVSGEYYPTECVRTAVKQTNAREIKVLDKSVVADTFSYHCSGGVSYETLFPASTVYKNSLGGTVIVFGGDAKTEFHFTTAFSMLNDTRKKQLVRLLKAYGDLPLYVPDDDEVYLRVADMEDGSLFCGFFNISLDPINNIRLVCKNEPEEISYLTPDGKLEPCKFTFSNGEAVLDLSADVLTPQILKIK